MKLQGTAIELNVPLFPDGQPVLLGEEVTLDPGVNLSREKDYWLSSRINSSRIWRNSDCLVLGKFLQPEKEVHIDRALEFGVPVLKRTTGGGAVFHDPGNINYSLYLDTSIVGGLRVEDSLQLLSFPVTDLLDNLGIPWSWVPPNNVYVEGRKISGSAQARHKNRLLHHGTLLVDCDLDKMNHLLKPGGRSRMAPVINLTGITGNITPEDATLMLTETLGNPTRKTHHE